MRVTARILVVAACVVVGPSSCSADPPQPSVTGVTPTSSSSAASPTTAGEAGWSSYTDPSGAFVVSYPSGWTVTDHSAGSTAAVEFAPVGGGLGMGVSIAPRAVILGNFATTKGWITGLGGSAGPSVESGPARLLGLPGYRAVNRVVPPTGRPWLVESVGALGHEVGILVIVNRAPDDRAAIDRFARMIDSLQVTGEPPA